MGDFEDWGEGEGLNWKKIIFVIALIVVVIVSVSVVLNLTGITGPSNPSNGNSGFVKFNPIELSATSLLTGETLTIHVSLNQPLEDIQIMLYEEFSPEGSNFDTGGALIDTGYTDSNGIIDFERTLKTPGTYVYYAECIIA